MVNTVRQLGKAMIYAAKMVTKKSSGSKRH